MKITVRKTRDVLTPDLLAKLKRCQRPTKALEAMGLTVVSLATRAFTQASLRPSWAPLRPATIKAKRRGGYGSKPLVSSGALAHSPRIVSVSGSKVVVGSDRKAGSHSLAGIHQLGAPKAGIPARPVWPFDKQGRPTAKARTLLLAAARRALALEKS